MTNLPIQRINNLVVIIVQGYFANPNKILVAQEDWEFSSIPGQNLVSNVPSVYHQGFKYRQIRIVSVFTPLIPLHPVIPKIHTRIGRYPIRISFQQIFCQLHVRYGRYTTVTAGLGGLVPKIILKTSWPRHIIPYTYHCVHYCYLKLLGVIGIDRFGRQGIALDLMFTQPSSSYWLITYNIHLPVPVLSPILYFTRTVTCFLGFYLTILDDFLQ